MHGTCCNMLINRDSEPLPLDDFGATNVFQFGPDTTVHHSDGIVVS
jgi:hypothetical protein